MEIQQSQMKIDPTTDRMTDSQTPRSTTYILGGPSKAVPGGANPVSDADIASKRVRDRVNLAAHVLYR